MLRKGFIVFMNKGEVKATHPRAKGCAASAGPRCYKTKHLNFR